MPSRAPRHCTTAGCGNESPGGKCVECRGRADVRPSAGRRGYDREHVERFRAGVLERDPQCVCTDATHANHLGGACAAEATVADHYPLTRRQLVDQGADPDDPRHGRGLCERCHNRHTAATSPGGWNKRNAHRRAQ